MDAEKRNIVVLTEAELKNRARSYVPTKEKEAFLAYAATRSFDRLEVSTEEGEAVPPMWKENLGRKNRYLLTALAGLYLRLTDPEKQGWELGDEAYEALAESQLMGQLERMKKRTGDQQLRDAIYDLIADYHLLEKLLNAECYGLLNAMNDPVARLRSLMAAAVTPEALREMQAQAEETRKELESYLAGRGKAT